MGLYDDIQTDVAEAFDTDLLDAIRIISFVDYTDTYNEDTMQNVLTENSVDVRSVRISDFEGENVDLPTSNDTVKYLVLDSEKKTVVFELDMKIVDDTKEYKISGISRDPAGATWTITGRKWS